MDEMSNLEKEWLTLHIPHRLRVAIARLGRDVPLFDTQPWNPKPSSVEDRIKRRCETDAIYEGRLVATRCLIEFVGIKMDRSGRPCEKCHDDRDLRMCDIRLNPKPKLIGPDDPNADNLAKVWKGCSQACVHAGNGGPQKYRVEEDDLAAALRIIIPHLNEELYKARDLDIREYVWALPPCS